MSDPFDPFQEWLDLSPGPRPPDHYTLLGLAPREVDAGRIAQAADSQMARLRKVRPGARLAEWGRLLDQIRAVKTCLLDPASKAAYDATLPAAPPRNAPVTGHATDAPAPGTAPSLATPPGLATPPSATSPPQSTWPAPPADPGTTPPPPGADSEPAPQPAESGPVSPSSLPPWGSRADDSAATPTHESSAPPTTASPAWGSGVSSQAPGFPDTPSPADTPSAADAPSAAAAPPWGQLAPPPGASGTPDPAAPTPNAAAPGTPSIGAPATPAPGTPAMTPPPGPAPNNEPRNVASPPWSTAGHTTPNDTAVSPAQETAGLSTPPWGSGPSPTPNHSQAWPGAQPESPGPGPAPVSPTSPSSPTEPAGPAIPTGPTPGGGQPYGPTPVPGQPSGAAVPGVGAPGTGMSGTTPSYTAPTAFGQSSGTPPSPAAPSPGPGQSMGTPPGSGPAYGETSGAPGAPMGQGQPYGVMPLSPVAGSPAADANSPAGQSPWSYEVPRAVPAGNSGAEGAAGEDAVPTPGYATPVAGGGPGSGAANDLAATVGEAVPAPAQASQEARRRRRSKSSSLTAIAMLVLIIAGLMATAWYMMNRRAQEAARASAPPESAAETPLSAAPDAPSESPLQQEPKPAASDDAQSSPDGDSASAETPATTALAEADPPPQETPQETPPATETPAAPIDPTKQATFRQAVADVRQAMADRALDESRQRIEAAVAAAQTPAEQDEITRLEIMQQHLDEFWRVFANSVRGLPYPSVLPIGDTFVAIVETDAKGVWIKNAGRLEYHSIQGMSIPLAMAVIDKSFGKDAESQMILGTFLATDRDGDRKRARQLWQQAAKSGIQAAKQLLPELDLPAPGGTSKRGSAASRGKPGGGLRDGPMQAGGQRVALPTDKVALDEAQQLLRARFGSEIKAAKSVGDKEALARQLLSHAQAAKDDNAARLVLIEKARDLAAGAGKPAAALDAVDQMAAYFDVDAVQMKGEVLGQVVRHARGFQSHRDIATAALQVGHEAFETGDTGLARKMADLALEAARKTGSPSLMREAAAAGKRLEAQQKKK